MITNRKQFQDTVIRTTPDICNKSGSQPRGKSLVLLGSQKSAEKVTIKPNLVWLMNHGEFVIPGSKNTRENQVQRPRSKEESF